MNTMRAALMDGFGSVETLRIAEVPLPGCEPRDVLVKVAAAGVNPVDWKECEGYLKPFYNNYQDSWVPGYDAAGIVERVGREVRAFKPGDRVVAFSDRRDNGHNGTYAEYLRVLPNAVSRVPASISLEAAAAIPTAGLTGYQALFWPTKGNLKAGDCVLIHGASGGVGSYAVQFAKAGGLSVAATCSARNVPYVRSLGADLVLDYAEGQIAARVRNWRAEGVHAVIDCVSGSTLPDALDALARAGRLISIATLNQDGDIVRQTDEAASRGFTKIFSIIDFGHIDEDLQKILSLMEASSIRPPPMEFFPLDQASEALKRMKAGGIRGKAVLTIAREAAGRQPTGG